MSKRILNVALLFLILACLVALLTLVSANKGGSAVKVANVVDSHSSMPQRQGVWSDLPVFPTVSLNFGSGSCNGDPGEGTSPLKLKRAVAVAYPPNGKIYILGGRHRADGDDIGNWWIWEYTPGSNSYIQKNIVLDTCQYGTRSVSNMAAALLTGADGPRIYLVGGSSTTSQVSRAVRVYDPVADTLSASDDWPASPVRTPGGYVVYNNKLYIFGGYGIQTTSTMYADTWVFDPMAPSGSRWSQIISANLGTARTSIAGAVLDGYIYAIGGDVMSGTVNITVTPKAIVERMNPLAASPTWQTVASLPSARGDMGVWAYDTGTGYEISGHVVVAGGNYPAPDSTAYMYDPAGNIWSAFTPLSRARRNVAYTQMRGILYAFGGYNVLPGPIYDGANDSMSYDATGGGTPFPTNTPFATSTPVPTIDLFPGYYFNYYCNGQPSDYELITYSAPPGAPFPITSTMRFESSSGDFRDYAVPPGISFYIVHCLYPCLSGSTPFTLTVDYHNDIVETNESNNVTVFPTVVHPTPCPSYTPTRTLTPTVPPTNTRTPTGILVASSTPWPPTNTAVITDTPAPVPTEPTACAIRFTDVPLNHTFYPYIKCLACRGIINGYTTGCETGNPCFRPENNVTRAQLSKIISNSAGWNESIPLDQQNFEDVRLGHTFWVYIERMVLHSVIQGYACGGPGEPCVGPENRPYFRPGAPATRAQISKMVVVSAGLPINTTGGPHFSDVAPGSTFYTWIETLYNAGVIQGYGDGTFGPNNNATRGQTAKIVSNVFFPDCDTSKR